MLSIEDVRPWSGHSSGRFHIDFLGVKTDTSFWRGMQPTRAGYVRLSAPSLSELYLEYAALIMAATIQNRPFRTLEIGAGWGVWSVRAAMLGFRLSIPVRTTAFEAMPWHVERTRAHYMTNGLAPEGHSIVNAAVSPGSKHVWMRYADRADLGARVVAEDWVARKAGVPILGMQHAMALPCVDGGELMRVPAAKLDEHMRPDVPIDFVHIRIGPGPEKLFEERFLKPDRIGVVVVANVSDTDRPNLDSTMRAMGYRLLLALENGTKLASPRSPTTVRGHFRIFCGHALSEEQHAAVQASLVAKAVTV
jgi:hypothetical protein